MKHPTGPRDTEALFRGLTPAQESLFLTLYFRALDYRSTSPILADATSARLADTISYDFRQFKAMGAKSLDLALRTNTLDNLVRAFVARHSEALVLDLGCGLDPRQLRCHPSTSTDWYDIDFPVVVEMRKRFLPRTSAHLIGADLTSPGWMDDIPADRPTMLVADGLMAFMSDQAFTAMARRMTSHFSTGELAFNAYTPLDLWAANFLLARARGSKFPARGISDPHEPERWGARLTLIEELLLYRAPEVARFPQPYRTLARLCALSTRVCRHTNWVVRYSF
jgi:O-methyltransferase involved in polyketide biosynthesis